MTVEQPKTSESIRVLARYKSRSSPDKVYTVAVSTKGGPPTCSCPGFTYRNKCWHVDEWPAERIVEKYR